MDKAEPVVICGANWLGDSVMSLPAVQMFKRVNPACRITMLVKSKLAPFWRMHPDIDDVLDGEMGARGTLATARRVRGRAFKKAFVFPKSFRSALIPCLAGIPERTGMPGHQRSWLLTRTVLPMIDENRYHQAWEYVDILGLEGGTGCARGDGLGGIVPIEPPRLAVPDALRTQGRERLGLADGERAIGFMPGAARGPAKRWPSESFVETGRRLVGDGKHRVIVMGTASERGLCARIAMGIGARAVDCSGQTTLPELAALLGVCSVVVCNDSGGMHLAAAVGPRVVAIFGMTDPFKTGPLGTGHRVMVGAGIKGRRDIARVSRRAASALRSVTPRGVVETVLEMLAG